MLASGGDDNSLKLWFWLIVGVIFLIKKVIELLKPMKRMRNRLFRIRRTIMKNASRKLLRKCAGPSRSRGKSSRINLLHLPAHHAPQPLL